MSELRRIAQSLVEEAQRRRRGSVGVAEGLLHGVSGAAAQPASWAAGLHELIGQGLNKLRPVEDRTSFDPQGVADYVAREGTYMPRTEEGKKYLEGSAQNPIVKALARWNQRGQDKLEGSGVPPWVSGAILGTIGGMDIPGVPEETALSKAQAAARSGEHLKPNSSGGYVGGPPVRLSDLRKALDKKVETGAFGADWYERARGAIKEMSGDDPAKADRLSKMLALYSPQQTPDINMGHALKQINDIVLKGEKSTVKPFYERQAVKGRQIMAGESPNLGPKVGVYEEHINPNKADQAKVQGVNDVWMGRAYGYPKAKKAAGSGFGEAQHRFMSGENLLAADRAGKKGLLPEGVEPNVGNVQAAAWTGERYKDLLAQKGNARKAKALFDKQDLEGALALDEKLKKRAAQSYDREVLDKYTGADTYEKIPGRKTGHMEGAIDLPYGEKEKLTKALGGAEEGQHDPYYEALGMYDRPGKTGQGFFDETVQKPIIEPALRDPESGQMWTGADHGQAYLKAPDEAQARVPDYEPVSYSDDYEGNLKLRAGRWAGFKKNPEGTFLTRKEAGDLAKEWDPHAGAMTRGHLTSEDLYNVPKVDVTYHDKNPNFTARPMVGFKGGKLDPASESLLNQVSLLRAGDDVQASTGWHAPESAPWLGDHYAIGDSKSLPWGEQGSGDVTSMLYDKVSPRVGEKVYSSERIRNALERSNLEENKFANDNWGRVGPPRADVQKRRAMLAESGWEGLRQKLLQAGGGDLKAGAMKYGLPGLALTYFGSQDEQPQ